MAVPRLGRRLADAPWIERIAHDEELRMPGEERDPFQESPRPPFVEVDEVDLEIAWEAEENAGVVCPGCEREPKGRFAGRGTSSERRWVSFSPCGHVVVLADWAVA
jgi:hypothetical protein